MKAVAATMIATGILAWALLWGAETRPELQVDGSPVEARPTAAGRATRPIVTVEHPTAAATERPAPSESTPARTLDETWAWAMQLLHDEGYAHEMPAPEHICREVRARVRGELGTQVDKTLAAVCRLPDDLLPRWSDWNWVRRYRKWCADDFRRRWRLFYPEE